MINFDDLIICDRCGGDAAYKQEINENISIIQCLGCGFQTNSLMKREETFFKEQLQTLPELYKDLMTEDKEGKIWLPTIINLPTQGMIFANGSNKETWKWAAVKALPVKEEEKENYPIPGKKGKYYEYRMDMSTMQEFEEKDFMEALSFLGLFENTLENSE